jgi:hypothetical protein
MARSKNYLAAKLFFESQCLTLYTLTLKVWNARRANARRVLWAPLFVYVAGLSIVTLPHKEGRKKERAYVAD